MNTLEHRETLWATDTKLKDRFGQKWELDAATGCWRWLGTMIPNGYGVIKPTGDRKNAYAHRVSYVLFNGYLEPGLTIDHLCRNKRCVNPEHLASCSKRRQDALPQWSSIR